MLVSLVRVDCRAIGSSDATTGWLMTILLSKASACSRALHGWMVRLSGSAAKGSASEMFASIDLRLRCLTFHIDYGFAPADLAALMD